MTGYARSLPHLGFDPAPGDVGLTQHLARRHYQVAQEARQVLAMVERLDLQALQGRAADAMRALQATFPPALRNTAGAADTLHAATSSWANQLTGFQAEADALERQAANASAHQQALQAKQAALPPGSAVLTADLESASAAVSGIRPRLRTCTSATWPPPRKPPRTSVTIRACGTGPSRSARCWRRSWRPWTSWPPITG